LRRQQAKARSLQEILKRFDWLESAELLMVSKVSLEWFEQLPCAVTVCDKDYTILYLNGKSAEMNSKDGGKALIGKSLKDCHPPKAQKKTRKIMAASKPNVYTIEKKGKKKLVFQGQWKKGGRTAGLVELVIELPENMPHFVRTSS